MYETALAANGYASSTRSTGDARSIEYQVFARVTRDLAKAETGSALTLSELARALHENIRLWTLLAADVAQEKNGLTSDLRSKLFYLFEFTRLHSRKVLDGAASPDALVEINKSVMRGLRPAVGDSEAE